jgi:hypothetical protein
LLIVTCTDADLSGHRCIGGKAHAGFSSDILERTEEAG